jgi:hypothetical protein
VDCAGIVYTGVLAAVISPYDYDAVFMPFYVRASKNRPIKIQAFLFFPSFKPDSSGTVHNHSTGTMYAQYR